MNGCLIPHTPFAVDFWRSRECGNTRLFFLSHMHADHTSGLSPSWKHPIYCSEITAKLLVHKFHIPPALVHPLGVGESHILALDETGQETMTVALFDANHCPGAVMFLFQGYFGSIFYTGDFRYSPEMFDHEVLANRPPVDVLYLDNTYCSPECAFPSRTQATQMIKDIISRHPEHDIILGMTMLGKEDLLVDLAKTFQTWVVVSPQRLESLKLLELPNVFTTDPEAGRIRVALKYQITRKNMEKWNQERPTIAILPSALYTGLDGKPYANQPDVHIVPYSDHSSYRELHDFVSRLKPRSIIPVVKGNSRGVFGSSLQARADMHCFDNYLDTSAKTAFQIPESVRKFMFHSSHSSVIDAFTEDVSERKGKSARNCVPAKKGRPMGVVFIDSPQNTPEKAKPQETVAPENDGTDICEETTDKTVATSSEMFLGSSKCMEKSENRVEETVPSCNAGGQVKNRKRKLPASIAILAQAFAYHTGQKGDCDIDPVYLESSPKRIHHQSEEKSNGFANGDGKKQNSLLAQQERKGLGAKLQQAICQGFYPIGKKGTTDS
ncbi:PREDICTED: 5' exonuclease Apollo-like [Branchiostoma belcheri]|uniref:5' exonuclease Apollo n=1 Tax=Branchiostoma belcheri TaxID=7741 RepID=A0A6P4Y1T4_BRABE|nr:PREDICTED: 5' exonuclease Apollo-like [Branchiostoma belcheri]